MVQYCMKVHVFGAASSPACANYALQQTAKDNDFLFPQDVIATVLENFYMDDCLQSVNSAEEAIRMSDELSQLLKKGRFNLTKWLSNSDRVISNFALKKINANVKDKPLARRGVLSQVSAVFNPLGFAAPIILKVKLILQELCRLENVAI